MYKYCILFLLFIASISQAANESAIPWKVVKDQNGQDDLKKSDEQFADEIHEALKDELKNNITVSKFDTKDLPNCKWPETLGAALKSNRLLGLNFEYLYIYDGEAAQLARSLEENSSLALFVLSYVEISVYGMKTLMEALTKKSSLKRLGLGFGYYGRKPTMGAFVKNTVQSARFKEQIVAIIKTNPGLDELHVPCLDAEDVKTIVYSLKDNTTLKGVVLHADTCNYGAITQPITEMLKANLVLINFWVATNQEETIYCHENRVALLREVDRQIQLNSRHSEIQQNLSASILDQFPETKEIFCCSEVLPSDVLMCFLIPCYVSHKFLLEKQNDGAQVSKSISSVASGSL